MPTRLSEISKPVKKVVIMHFAGNRDLVPLAEYHRRKGREVVLIPLTEEDINNKGANTETYLPLDFIDNNTKIIANWHGSPSGDHFYSNDDLPISIELIANIISKHCHKQCDNVRLKLITCYPAARNAANEKSSMEKLYDAFQQRGLGSRISGRNQGVSSFNNDLLVPLARLIYKGVAHLMPDYLVNQHIATNLTLKEEEQKAIADQLYSHFIMPDENLTSQEKIKLIKNLLKKTISARLVNDIGTKVIISGENGQKNPDVYYPYGQENEEIPGFLNLQHQVAQKYLQRTEKEIKNLNQQFEAKFMLYEKNNSQLHWLPNYSVVREILTSGIFSNYFLNFILNDAFEYIIKQIENDPEKNSMIDQIQKLQHDLKNTDLKSYDQSLKKLRGFFTRDITNPILQAYETEKKIIDTYKKTVTSYKAEKLNNSSEKHSENADEKKRHNLDILEKLNISIEKIGEHQHQQKYINDHGVYQNDLTEAKSLLEQITPQITCLEDKEARSELLYLAIEEELYDVVEMLLEKNDIFDINQPDQEGSTPLHIAVSSNNIAMIELLRLKGAKINKQDDILFYLDKKISANEFEKMLDFLIQHGININQRDNSGNTLLTHLFTSGISIKDKIEKAIILINKNIDVNMRNYKGDNALIYRIIDYYSARYNFYSLCESEITLLTLFAEKVDDINAQKKQSGETLLHVIADIDGPSDIKPKTLEAIELLLNAGADAEIKDFSSFGRAITPLAILQKKRIKDKKLKEQTQDLISSLKKENTQEENVNNPLGKSSLFGNDTQTHQIFPPKPSPRSHTSAISKIKIDTQAHQQETSTSSDNTNSNNNVSGNTPTK